MASSTGGGGVEKNVAIVYTIEGVDQAASDQDRLAGALGETSEALGEATVATERAEQATAAMGDTATEAGQRILISQQQISAFASGLGQLSAIIGTDSEAGALMSRMSHFASTGIQIGSIFGPGGAVVGGILGAALPAMQSLATSMGVLEASHDTAAQAALDQAAALRTLASAAIAARQAATQRADIAAGEFGGMTPDVLRQQAEEGRQRIIQLQQEFASRGGLHERIGADGRGVLSGLTVEEQMPRAMREEIQRVTADVNRIDNELRAREQRAADDQDEASAAALGAANQSEKDRQLRGRERTRRGGSGERQTSWNKLEELMSRAGGGSDAIGFAAGLDAGDVSGRPSDFDVEIAGRRRPGGPGAGLRRGAELRAEQQAAERLADKQKELHDEQMARIQEQVDAWAGAGQKIGATLYSAFQIAAAGQEDLDVAMVKGFKNLAIQFGGQMINEGIGALLTAVGMAGTLNPGAGAKAAEGAGKIALGVGLGAAGAAVQVPSPSASQASTPRLGPQGGEQSGGGGSVVVNMNAPSVITGTRAQLGRELGRALRDSSQRFGRASL